MTADPRELINAIEAVRAGEGDNDCALDTVAASWTDADWREVLLEIPPDSGTFTARLELPWDVVIDTLVDWRERFAARAEAERSASLHGHVGLFLLTLISLRHSERRRSAWTEAGPDHECDILCGPLVEDSDVREALRAIYAPSEQSGPAHTEWTQDIDFETLTFHQHGTTSFLLKGETFEHRNARKTFALKCIVYPFLQIPTIGRATRTYARKFRLPDTGFEHLVRVWASADSWLLMDFVAGETLAERLAARSADRPPSWLAKLFDPHPSGSAAAVAGSRLRLEELQAIGEQLFRALADVEARDLEHGDLSPSNIIVVESDGRPELRLIDLGVNYLYLHSLPGRESVDAQYVAPEIRGLARAVDPGAAVEERAGSSERRKGDLYSLGQLLILLGCGRLEPDGTVPDAFYAEAPLLARFIEDLIDSDPGRRLLIFGPPAGEKGMYDQLRQDFVEELDAVRAAKAERINPHDVAWWRGMTELLLPLSGALGRQLRLWKLRRHQGLYGDRKRSFAVRRLLWWSTVATFMWGLCSVLVVMWTLRNAGWSWDNQLVFGWQRLTGAADDEFPVIDQLRAGDYLIPEGVHPAALGLLALSFTLVGVKYYQSLFASVTPMAIGWHSGPLTVHGVAAEVAMRSVTFATSLMTLIGLIVQPRWWLLLTALGMTVVTAVNVLSSSFASAVLKTAREQKLSTVPASVPGVSLFASWIPGNLLYVSILWAVGVLLYVNVLHDAMFYVVVITFLNVVQLYLVKCGRQGPGIRAGLVRSSVTAERLRLILRESPR